MHPLGLWLSRAYIPFPSVYSPPPKHKSHTQRLAFTSPDPPPYSLLLSLASFSSGSSSTSLLFCSAGFYLAL